MSSKDKNELPSLEALTIGEKKAREPENYLNVNVMGLGASSSGSLKFQSFKLVGKFGITGDKKYSEVEADLDIPKLISPSEMRLLKGKDLGQGHDTAVKITNYSAYHEIKQNYFFEWLKNKEYFKEVEKKTFKKPNFVCFSGRITDPMQTPLKTRFGEWEIYAAKYLDTIFIWDEKNDHRDSHGHTKESFYGVSFEALMTGKSPGSVNEYEKAFMVQEATFGSHQLLLVSEVDAKDDNGDWVEIKAYKGCSPKGMEAKYLGYWAQSVVAGVKFVATGRRDDNGRLLETTSGLTLDDVLAKAKCSYSVNKCYEFQNRLLKWIESHFEKNDPKIVKKFSWSGSSARVECKDVSGKEGKDFFPKDFIDSNNN